MNKKRLLLRILVPALIVILLILIAFLKTNSTSASGDKDVTDGAAATQSGDEYSFDAASLNLDTLKAYRLPIIIDFGADYCAPCRAFYPVLKAMNTEMQGKAIIKFVDTEKYGGIVAAFPIEAIPAQLIFNSDGTPYVPSENLNIRFTMYSSKDTNEHIYTIHEGGLTTEQLRAILQDMGVNQ